MKKVILAAAVALGLGAFSSCNNGTCDANAHNPKVDTLTAVFGEMYGYGVASETNSNPEFSKKEFMAGMQAVLAMNGKSESYNNGMQMGMRITEMLAQIKEREQIDINAKKWFSAFKRAFMSDSTLNPTMYQAQVMRLMNEIKADIKANDPNAIANKKNEEKFIADSLANNKDVKLSEGGVYYKVITEGNGKQFSATDRILTKYTGRHLDGTVFDSSNGEAIAFSPRAVVPGFGEMLKLMSPGAKYIIYIPAKLAYGAEGQGDIQPNEMLIFEIETVDVEKK